MNYLDFSDKTHTVNFPAVSGSPASPLSLYNAANDIVYVNTGSGWQAGVQPGTNSVYPAVSGATAAVKAAIVTSVSTTTSAPTAVHIAVASKATSVINNGH